MRSIIFATAVIFAMAAIFATAGCALHGDKKEPQKEESEPRLPVKVPAMTVRFENVERKLVIPGVVAALPDHSVKVSPAMSGKLVSVAVVPGDHVHRHQLLALLDDRHIRDQLEQASAGVQTAQAAVTQAEENLSLAKDTLERQKKLFQAEVGAKKDIVQAENQLETITAQMNAAKSQVKSAQAAKKQIETELQFTKVLSPIDGIISNRYLNGGDSTDPNSPIVQVVDLKVVLISAAMPADVPDRMPANERVRQGDRGVVSTGAHAGTTYSGIVVSISPQVDPQSNTIRVQLRCVNTDGELREGQTVSVSIVSQIDRAVMLLPKSAIVPDPAHPDREMVYVVENGKAKRTPVTRGVAEGDKVEIVAGLKPGQIIIAREAYGLPDDSLVEPEIIK